MWTSVEDWQAAYPNAPKNAEAAALYLGAAQEQCEAFAPALAAGATVPDRYKLAVQFQARELYTASRRESGDTIGGDGFVIRVRPLTLQVRQLLRPPRPIGVVG